MLFWQERNHLSIKNLKLGGYKKSFPRSPPAFAAHFTHIKHSPGRTRTSLISQNPLNIKKKTKKKHRQKSHTYISRVIEKECDHPYCKASSPSHLEKTSHCTTENLGGVRPGCHALSSRAAFYSLEESMSDGKESKENSPGKAALFLLNRSPNWHDSTGCFDFFHTGFSLKKNKEMFPLKNAMGLNSRSFTAACLLSNPKS